MRRRKIGGRDTGEERSGEERRGEERGGMSVLPAHIIVGQACC